MSHSLAERFVWNLSAATLEQDEYGRQILGDLVEGRERLVRDEGELAAARWLCREGLRSWLAFLPSLRIGAREVVVPAVVAAGIYSATVNGADPLADALTRALHIGAGSAAAWFYMILVGLLGLLAGAGASMMRRGGVAGAITFLGLALVFGVHHVFVSPSQQLVFRATKVAVFLTLSVLGSALPLVIRSPRRPLR